MESAKQSPTVEEIASLIVEKLTAAGKLSDLSQADLMTIEEETLNQVDQVTRVVMNQLLGRQAKMTESPPQLPEMRGIAI